MNKAEKVVWTEGMFLRPHHFQRAESHLQNHIREWGLLQKPYLWGFLSLELDDTMLRQGCVALSSASGVLPDGTFFAFHEPRYAPAPLAIADNITHERVVLALPCRRGGREEVIFSEDKESLARYVTWESEVDDDNAISVGPAALQFGRLRLKLMLEKDLSAEWTAMGVVQVLEKRNDNHLRHDAAYIPPMLNAINSAPLYAMVNDLQSLLHQRSQQFANRLRQPGRFNTTEMVEFSLLALINRHIGLISHIKTLPLIHPEALWRDWLAFASELTTWTSARTPDEVLPVYDHDNLAVCFQRLVLMLRQGLSLVMEEHAIQLPLTERTHGLNVATLPTVSMAREFGFVLAVKASVPGETLQTHFPAQMKVAPVTKIRDLVQLQLPGMKLRAMPVAPPQIPWHAGYNYFELEKGGELWNEMEKSGAFALHLAGEFPGLDMEFWAIRSPNE